MHAEPEQIGERLAGARERAGLTVEDVVFQTRISRDVIVALEDGDFTVFSSPAYAKSFLAQYSCLLNVDASIWIEALEPAAFSMGDSPHLVWVPASREWMEKPPARNSGSGWVAAVSVLALSCGMVFLGFKGYEYLERKLAAEPAPQEAPAAVVPAKPVAAAPPDDVPAKPAKPAEPAADDKRKPVPRATLVREPD